MNDTLRIASFNAQDFYLLLDRDYSRPELETLSEEEYQAMNSSIFNRNKDRGKIAEVAQIILEGDFDLVGLCEIGGTETLSAFNRIYLGGRYDYFLHEENSRRGIYVGALVKKGRFPAARAASQGGMFSRNLLRVELGSEGGGLSVFVLHLKSQYGGDLGIERRIAEVERLAELVPPLRCVVMGDFNGILIRGESQFEYDSFLALPFTDVLEAIGVPPERRRTHYHFSPAPNFAQLDYIFVSNDLEVAGGGVIEREVPLNRAQRNRLPSDHLFIRAEIRLPGAASLSRSSRIAAAVRKAFSLRALRRDFSD